MALDSPGVALWRPLVYRGYWGELKELSLPLLFCVRLSWFCPPPVQDEAGARSWCKELVLGTCSLSAQQNLHSAKVGFALLYFGSALLAIQTSFLPVCGKILSWCHVLAAWVKAKIHILPESLNLWWRGTITTIYSYVILIKSQIISHTQSFLSL